MGSGIRSLCLCQPPTPSCPGTWAPGSPRHPPPNTRAWIQLPITTPQAVLAAPMGGHSLWPLSLEWGPARPRGKCISQAARLNPAGATIWVRTDAAPRRDPPGRAIRTWGKVTARGLHPWSGDQSIPRGRVSATGVAWRGQPAVYPQGTNSAPIPIPLPLPRGEVAALVSVSGVSSGKHTSRAARLGASPPS